MNNHKNKNEIQTLKLCYKNIGGKFVKVITLANRKGTK